MPVGPSQVASGDFKADYTARGSDSRAAQDLLAGRSPAAAGEQVTVVVHAAGPVTDPAVRQAVDGLLTRIATVPHVLAAPSLYGTPGAVSADGRTLQATVQLDAANPDAMPVEDTRRIVDLAAAADTGGLQVAVGGQVVESATQGSIGSEGIGLAAAAIILLLVFGPIVAAGLPILVAVAGSAVIVSLLGLFAMGLSAMRGAALVTILAVLVVMLAAVTLLPALLGFVGHRMDRLRLPVPRVPGRPLGARWAVGVQRRPWTALGAGLVLLGLLALPFLGVRYGFPDAGNDKAGTTTRTAYDLLADGFGPGANGPLLLVSTDDGGTLAAVRDRIEATPGVASVSAPQPAPDGGAALMTVVPTTSPQSADTERLVTTLRDTVAGTGVHIGGVTAAAIDSNEDTASRLPLLIGGVVGLSFLLLLTVFRSLVVAVKAAVLNLLSLAAYGVVALVLEGGWAGQLIGIDTPTPLPAFVPVLMFAVLFGLSMDYEVFLLTRIRERWLRTGDSTTSVTEGLTRTARVVTAAAAIMIAVFAAFVPSPMIFLKVIGVGMAAAILVDATVVRMLLVPAAMQLLGRANWWLPSWLDRVLPKIRIEGAEDHEEPATQERELQPA